MKMLVDTGALLALTLTRDQHHGRAAAFARQHPECVSFEVMDRLGLTTAFAFDGDFRDCGYQTVP